MFYVLFTIGISNYSKPGNKKKGISNAISPPILEMGFKPCVSQNERGVSGRLREKELSLFLQ